MPGDSSEVAHKYLGAFCYFWKIQIYRTRRLLTVQKDTMQVFSKKKQTNKTQTLNYQGLGLRKGKKFPRVKCPKISFKRVYTHARAHTHTKCNH